MMKENVPWMPGLYVSVDGDIFELRNNNWVSNLYWCTPKENTEKAVREGRMKPGINEEIKTLIIEYSEINIQNLNIATNSR